jgi:hypothetical protein
VAAMLPQARHQTRGNMELGVEGQQEQQQHRARALSPLVLGITTAASACASKQSGWCKGSAAEYRCRHALITFTGMPSCRCW